MKGATIAVVGMVAGAALVIGFIKLRKKVVG
jgi:hypothetical protein